MRTTRNLTGMVAVAATALTGVGLTAPSVAAAAPAPTTASAAASTAGIECTAASRLFQLRAGGTEVWTATVSRPNSSKPKVYNWQRAYDVPGGKALSLTAHSGTAKSTSVQLLLSDEYGALRSLAYNKDKGKVTASTTLVRGSATSPGKHRYSAMTSDGTRVWAATGGRLKVLTGITTTKAPRATATVGGLKGFYPQAFYGNADGSHEIAWTDGDGTLRYGDISASGGWKLKSSKTVAKGWKSEAITSPGGGVVLRAVGDTLKRYQASASDGTSKGSTISSSLKTATPAPMTTVPDLCSGSGGASAGQRIVDTAQGQVGVREGTSAADKFLTWAWPGHTSSGTPWCAAFTSWVANHELKLTSFKDMAVTNWVSAARNGQGGLAQVTTPQPGDLIAFDWDGGHDYAGSSHIGIVRSVNKDGTVRTIEGNSGSPQGVVNQTRSRSSAPNVTYLRIGS